MEELDFKSEVAVYLGTQEALAAHLGVERKSIQRWHKRKDCPGRVKEGFSIRDWEQFVERNKLGRKPGHSKVDLDNEKVALGNERMRLVNAKLRGEVEHRDEVVKVLGEMMAGFVLGLGQMKHTIAEECVGLPLGEAVKRIDRRHKECLATLALGDWAQKKTFWSSVYAGLSDLHRIHDLGRGARIT